MLYVGLYLLGLIWLDFLIYLLWILWGCIDCFIWYVGSYELIIGYMEEMLY